jgi:hypothetical protein
VQDAVVAHTQLLRIFRARLHLPIAELLRFQAAMRRVQSLPADATAVAQFWVDFEVGVLGRAPVALGQRC